MALGFLLSKILKDVTSNVNDEHKSKIQQDVDNRLITIFGADWSKLPVTGPRMMVMVLILNVALLPFGIVPATIFEVAIIKSKEYGVDNKFATMLQNTKLASEGSKEKFSDLIEYAGEAGTNVKEKLSFLTDETGSAVTKLFDKTKKIFGKLGSKTEKR
ncbi:MAG: hypothetical protein GPJ54_00715 [Candidatus Heimdallarchaeota archaeon]|nr:hypothetical protein [Candidatus Heimdallarchaeota archaeon]